MQGTLNEIDLRSILQLIELGQRTGDLLVETYQSPVSSCPQPNDWQDWAGRDFPKVKSNFSSTFWFVFFVNGQIAYAAAQSSNSLSRLRDYLSRYQADRELEKLKNSAIVEANTPEYSCLWLLLEQKIITPAQGRSILQNMVQETLFDVLSLHQGSFIFEIGPSLAPQLTQLKIGTLVTKITKQVQQWKQLHPQIQSPAQCPIITHPQELRATLPENTYQGLYLFCDGITSLRQIARYLNRDLVTVAKAIYPYIQKGWIQLSQPVNPEKYSSRLTPQRRVPRIVCLDDDLAIGKSVEAILSQENYESTIITDPVAALSMLFKIKPNLLLCDLAMPELDGYEICAMLRRSSAFRQTPIIILTGQEGYIDRVKARIIGANDYLTKPFGKNELLTLIEKHLG